MDHNRKPPFYCPSTLYIKCFFLLFHKGSIPVYICTNFSNGRNRSFIETTLNDIQFMKIVLFDITRMKSQHRFEKIGVTIAQSKQRINGFTVDIGEETDSTPTSRALSTTSFI